MVQAAFLILSLAVCLGLALALWHMRARRGDQYPGEGDDPAPHPDRRPMPIRLGGVLHGIIGMVGLGVLILATRGPPRGVASGVSSFGLAAAILFGLALLLGIAFLLSARWWRQGSGLLIAVHAGIAITGYVIFLAWAALA